MSQTNTAPGQQGKTAEKPVQAAPQTAQLPENFDLSAFGAIYRRMKPSDHNYLGGLGRPRDGEDPERWRKTTFVVSNGKPLTEFWHQMEAVSWAKRVELEDDKGLNEDSTGFEYTRAGYRHVAALVDALKLDFVASGLPQIDNTPCETFYRGAAAIMADDYDYGLPLIREAMAMHNPSAYFMMGSLHLKGRGVPKDVAKGQDYVTEAAMRGNETARKHFGKLVKRADGTPAQVPPIDPGRPVAECYQP